MPSSRPDAIPTVLRAVQRLRPESILDVGVGFGKWGHLFREYTDIAAAEGSPERYEKAHWRVRIDGIEGFADYITPMHRYLYDEIHVGDAREVIRGLGPYDVVFLGDVIEHLDKGDGRRLLRACREKARKAVIVSTPAHYVEQGAACGNDLEIHRSHWSAADFRSLALCHTLQTPNQIRIALYPAEGIANPLARKPLRELVQALRFRLSPLKSWVKGLLGS